MSLGFPVVLLSQWDGKFWEARSKLFYSLIQYITISADIIFSILICLFFQEMFNVHGVPGIILGAENVKVTKPDISFFSRVYTLEKQLIN